MERDSTSQRMQLPEAQKSNILIEKKKRFFPRASRSIAGMPTILDLWPPELQNNTYVFFKPLKYVVIFYNNNTKLTHLGK